MQNAALMVAWLRGRLQFFTQPAALPLVLAVDGPWPRCFCSATTGAVFTGAATMTG